MKKKEILWTYWIIYLIANVADLPLFLHTFLFGGRTAITDSLIQLQVNLSQISTMLLLHLPLHQLFSSSSFFIWLLCFLLLIFIYISVYRYRRQKFYIYIRFFHSKSRYFEKSWRRELCMRRSITKRRWRSSELGIYLIYK